MFHLDRTVANAHFVEGTVCFLSCGPYNFVLRFFGSPKDRIRPKEREGGIKAAPCTVGERCGGYNLLLNWLARVPSLFLFLPLFP